MKKDEMPVQDTADESKSSCKSKNQTEEQSTTNGRYRKKSPLARPSRTSVQSRRRKEDAETSENYQIRYEDSEMRGNVTEECITVNAGDSMPTGKQRSIVRPERVSKISTMDDLLASQGSHTIERIKDRFEEKNDQGCTENEEAEPPNHKSCGIREMRFRQMTCARDKLDCCRQGDELVYRAELERPKGSCTEEEYDRRELQEEVLSQSDGNTGKTWQDDDYAETGKKRDECRKREAAHKGGLISLFVPQNPYLRMALPLLLVMALAAIFVLKDGRMNEFRERALIRDRQAPAQKHWNRPGEESEAIGEHPGRHYFLGTEEEIEKQTVQPLPLPQQISVIEQDLQGTSRVLLEHETKLKELEDKITSLELNLSQQARANVAGKEEQKAEPGRETMASKAEAPLQNRKPQADKEDKIRTRVSSQESGFKGEPSRKTAEEKKKSPIASWKIVGFSGTRVVIEDEKGLHFLELSQKLNGVTIEEINVRTGVIKTSAGMLSYR